MKVGTRETQIACGLWKVGTHVTNIHFTLLCYSLFLLIWADLGHLKWLYNPVKGLSERDCSWRKDDCDCIIEYVLRQYYLFWSKKVGYLGNALGHVFSSNVNNKNNLLHLYSAFLGNQSTLAYIWKGECPQPPPMCSNTWIMRRQPYCATMPTTHQLTGGEERVMKPISISYWSWNYICNILNSY